MIPRDDEGAITEIVETLAEQCIKRNIVITSGETAIHESYPGVEISVNVQGEYIERRPNVFQQNEVLLGAGSNGFTKIGEIFGSEFNPEFVRPTPSYYDALLDLLKQRFQISGMIHVTGGAFTRLKSPLGKGLDAIVDGTSLIPQSIFYEISSKEVPDEEMYRTFNCGVGLILAAPEKDLEDIIHAFSFHGFNPRPIGKVVSGTGKVKIKSAFSDKQIIY